MHVLLATAHPDLRLSLQILLSEEPAVNIVGSVSEGDGLMALLESTSPEIVITEWQLPGRSIAAIIAHSSKLSPTPKFIVLAKRLDEELVALASGAAAVTRQGELPSQLLEVFRHVRQIEA